MTLLKVKPLDDAEAIVVGICRARAKISRVMGALAGAAGR